MGIIVVGDELRKDEEARRYRAATCWLDRFWPRWLAAYVDRVAGRPARGTL